MMRVIHIDTGDFDETLYPIPPKRVERSATVCVHTPMPTGYNEWHEWARQASKTHRQIRCPRCGLLNIWLPKAEAKEIARQDLEAAKAATAAVMREVEAEQFARLKKKRKA